MTPDQSPPPVDPPARREPVASAAERPALAAATAALAGADVAELELGELEAALTALGAPRFRGRQIYSWVHARGITEFARMTDLSRELRATLEAAWTVATPRVTRKDVSVDGTTKYLLALADGALIEAVYIPDTPAQTFCISSQVGCAMGCGFCLTGKMGIIRNLTAGEIVGQVRVLASDLGLLDQAINIVLMGMGEPLHNYDQVMKALRMLASEHGLAMPAKRMTLSTVGVVPGIERLAQESFMPNLAISLHATTDAQRSAIVPINRKYGLAQLMAVCRAFPLKKRSRITFEYVLLDGVNDTPEDARRLVRLLNGIRAKVNLLPLNEASGIPFSRPSDDRVNRFARVLAEHDVHVTVRKSRGRDIRAACGQLIVEGARPSPGQRMAAAMDALLLDTAGG
jgi:23S rRNA (adenine2503-C2)-methyltransferase